MKNRYKKMLNEISKGGILALIIILMLAVVFGISWIATCGIIKLITLCFGLAFKWSVATGIWLILLLVSEAFRGNKN